MKWSWRLGKIAGIDLYMHFTFLLLVAWFGISTWVVSRSILMVLAMVVFLLSIFGCVVLHELGHALMARRYGIKTRDIILLPIGGVARLERMPENPLHELLVAIAGPAVNVVIAAILFVVIQIGAMFPLNEGMNAFLGTFVGRLMILNIILVVFNLLPAFPMDGGRVLRALLAMRMDYAGATRVAASFGQMMAMLFGIAGFFISPLLILIAVFVWIGAAQEANFAQMKQTFSGFKVSQAMLTDFNELFPTTRLSEVANLIISGSQHDFPVVEDGRVVGIVTRAQIFNALGKESPETPVGRIMSPDFRVASPDDPLDATFVQTQQEEKSSLVPVTQGRELVGLITPEKIQEFLMIQSALKQNGRPGPPESRARWGEESHASYHHHSLRPSRQY